MKLNWQGMGQKFCTFGKNSRGDDNLLRLRWNYFPSEGGYSTYLLESTKGVVLHFAILKNGKRVTYQ